jgi:hypothetical protein
MKTSFYLRGLIGVTGIMLIIGSCTKEGLFTTSNGLLKKIKNDGYITKEISYNNDNLVSEVNSTSFWRKFYYNNNNKLIKQEVAIDPNSLSSLAPSSPIRDFVDPEKTGISMYNIYEYDTDGRLTKQLNYIPKDGADELRSINTFEYNDNGLISKELLHDRDNVVTQFRTYEYDSNGNVIEEDYYTYLFIPEGTGPKHLSKITYEYDSYLNPYKIFEQLGSPGLYTNLNNIIKRKTINYDPAPGIDAESISEFAYEYNEKTKYPIKVINGEEFIYE